jgi:hypothetical protein
MYIKYDECAHKGSFKDVQVFSDDCHHSGDHLLHKGLEED